LWLDKIPTGISDDELDYVFNAKALFLSGSDISGTWNPLSLKPPPLEYPKAELPYVFIAPIIGIFPFSLFYARLPYVFINTMLVLVLYFIAKKLFGKPQAIAIGLLAAINPWMIYFGRTAFDSPISSFFYFSSLLVLLYAKRHMLLLAIPLLFLAFFSYIGSKIVFLPFSIIIILFSWKYINKKRYTKVYIFILLMSLGIMAHYLFFSVFQPGSSRTAEISTPFHYSIEQRVNKERKLSIESPINNLLENKISTYLKYSLEKYYGAFSPQLLFLYGDGRSTFSVWNHGLFFYIDVIFLIIGAYSLFKYHRKASLLLFAIVLISPPTYSIKHCGGELCHTLFSSIPNPIINNGVWNLFFYKLIQGIFKIHYCFWCYFSLRYFSF